MKSSKDRGNEPNSRQVAAAIVGRWLRSGAFPDRMLEGVVSDRAFVMEMVYGVVRWKRFLEWVVSRYADSSRNLAALPFLLTGIYQILLLDKVVSYAAVNETVQAARGTLDKRSAGFINAVLRRVVSDSGNLEAERAGLPLGIRESHPDILVNRWSAAYGDVAAEQLCRWNNTRPKIVVFPNAGLVSVEDLHAGFRAAGVECRILDQSISPCISVEHGNRMDDLPGYAEGMFFAADPSAAAAVELLAPQPGDSVMDACAAPGGKTLMILNRLGGEGSVVACDIHGDRLHLLHATLKRCRKRLKTIKVDWRSPGNIQGVYDRVLFDAPCGNTGVIKRRPDVRWRFSPKLLSRLTADQYRMLTGVSRLVKQGGVMVYSTCSIENEENGELIERWLTEHTEFKEVGRNVCFPPVDEIDGTFAVALRRDR